MAGRPQNTESHGGPGSMATLKETGGYHKREREFKT